MFKNNMQIDEKKQARIIGVSYLVTEIIDLVTNFLVTPGFQSTDTLLISEFQIQIGSMVDITIYTLVMCIIAVLYPLIKSIHRNRGTLDYVFSAGEVILGLVIGLMYLTFLVI